MAHQLLLLLMIDERNVALHAMGHVTALAALCVWRETTAVLEEDSLPLFLKGGLHCLVQGRRKTGFHLFSGLEIIQVADLDAGPSTLNELNRQEHLPVFALHGIIIGFH